MQEELVVVVHKSTTLVEIREPGSLRVNERGKIIDVRKIECSLKEARELHRQLGLKLGEIHAL